MAFMAQSIPLSNSFNLIYVSSEIVKTLIGSFGLVMVAPFTAIVGGFIFTRSGKVRGSQNDNKDSEGFLVHPNWK
ncbi:hypothetical protein MTBBW1_810001 [Desulfamplus magnetovallimortis]|uniref:YibE/F family protein n=2 Tax=Desulfamplus magnetovallimortis TaxID=1246637 RepID=A0A1W1HKB5_9BACT|nr:hypothetical protein MTBBW1_810001 [Desulfamplus magnetovallimortis]